MKRLLILGCLLAINIQIYAQDNVQYGEFLIKKSIEIDQIDSEMKKNAKKNPINEEEGIKNLCQQRILINKKISILDELTYSEELKKDQRLIETRKEILKDNNKWKNTLKNLDKVTINKYKEPLNNVCQKL